MKSEELIEILNKEDITVFVGMTNNVCDTRNIESIIMNGDTIQINLEGKNAN